jgi:hypothetical protein
VAKQEPKRNKEKIMKSGFILLLTLFSIFFFPSVFAAEANHDKQTSLASSALSKVKSQAENDRRQQLKEQTEKMQEREKNAEREKLDEMRNKIFRTGG